VYVATWNGFVFVAFVTDVFPRYIVGWRSDEDDENGTYSGR